ncbi:MAG: hypothetical protein AB4062_21920 [Crocosphaera sp.]
MENINFEVDSEIAKAYRNSTPEKQEAIKKVIQTFLQSVVEDPDINSSLEAIKKENKNNKNITKRQASDNLCPASGQSFLRHKATWKGDDLEECLQAVYDNRSQIDI